MPGSLRALFAAVAHPADAVMTRALEVLGYFLGRLDRVAIFGSVTDFFLHGLNSPEETVRVFTIQQISALGATESGATNFVGPP